MPFLSVLWGFRTPIAIITLILGTLFAVRWYGHTKYQEGFKEREVEIAQMKKDWSAEVLKWNKQVDNQLLELDRAKKEKQEVTKRNLEDLFKKQKINDQKRSNRENEIKANIKPTDTITVPSVFERVYNDAVKGSNIAGGNQGNIQVSEDRSSLVGQTKTFDASPFTQVIIGNLEEYNRLAIQCGKLIDTVNDLEASYDGTNNEGIKGTSDKDGGNLSSGDLGYQVRGPS